MPETFVLDCSVAAKWVLPEPDRGSALAWFDRYVSGEILLIAPDLLMAEFASLLAKRHRRKQITSEQAQEAYRLMTRCLPPLSEMRALVVPALAISLQHQLSLWDSVYVALAAEHNCTVLTADLRLFRAGSGRHPAIRLVQ